LPSFHEGLLEIKLTVALVKKKDGEQREKLPELSCPILRDVKIPKFLVQNEK